MRIYIAGPYSADPAKKDPVGQVEANVMNAIDAGIELAKRGWAPFIPHLTHFVEQRVQEVATNQRRFTGGPVTPALFYGDYCRMDDAFLAVCDAFLFLGSSPGADLELRLAERLGLTIYNSIDDVPSL